MHLKSQKKISSFHCWSVECSCSGSLQLCLGVAQLQLKDLIVSLRCILIVKRKSQVFIAGVLSVHGMDAFILNISECYMTGEAC